MLAKKLIVILGPTASGKTGLSLKLAKKFNGEIISADSRQVYKGLNVGAGKITKSQMVGIPHHLLDVANPKRKFTVSHYQKLAMAAIKKIQAKGRLPFLVGGTGFYIQSIVDGIVIPKVKPDWKLRKELETKSVDELFLMLKKLDPARAKSIDPKNPRRLIRAIEIVTSTGKPVPNQYRQNLEASKFTRHHIVQIGIKKSPAELETLIRHRLQKRIKGIVAEVTTLHRSGLSFKRLEELGLEYRFAAQYLQEKITYQKMLSILQKETEHYARRQMTWFKRDKRIYWIKSYQEAERIIKKHFNL